MGSSLKLHNIDSRRFLTTSTVKKILREHALYDLCIYIPCPLPAKLIVGGTARAHLEMIEFLPLSLFPGH